MAFWRFGGDGGDGGWRAPVPTTNPGSILKSVQASTWADWEEGVLEAIKQKELPKCPEEVLKWFAGRRGIC